MSDLAATNCGCEERCGCGCGCGNSGYGVFGGNSCSCILWIIILMCCCGNNNGCGFGGNNGDCCWLIVILLLLCGGCGGNNGCGCYQFRKLLCKLLKKGTVSPAVPFSSFLIFLFPVFPVVICICFLFSALFFFLTVKIYLIEGVAVQYQFFTF